MTTTSEYFLVNGTDILAIEQSDPIGHCLRQMNQFIIPGTYRIYVQHMLARSFAARTL